MAIDGAHDKVTSVVDNLCCIIFGSITCAGSFYAMFTIDAVAGLFVLFPVIGNFVVGPLLNKIYLKRYQESVPYYRKSDYVNRVIHLSDYAKEIRMSKVYGLMIKKYDNAVDGMGQVAKKHAKKGVPLYLLKHILSFTAIFEGALLYGAYRAMVTKSIDLPELAVLASLMTTAAFTMVNVVYNSFLELMKNGLFIQNIRTFLEYEEKIPENQEGIIPDKKIESIEFRNVYFAYKENDYIIKDLSFKVHGKNSIALVGHNGAGKSTIIKLLFRLYDPTKGDILLNGINIKEYNLKEYRLLFAAAFQDYKAMAYSVSDNVLMGRQIDNPGESVKTALKRAGVYNKITSLTKGVDTTLTKEFDEAGAVLSGGELQKIMVARAFANPAPIKVFDEPSSALDPIAEFDMFQSILEEMRENTVIFISHRLSSVKNAHTVLMLENGEIIERGTHNELIKQNVSEAENVIKRGQDVLSKLFEGITMLFTTGVFFFLKDATALLFIIASFILTFIFSKIINKLNFEIRLKENPVERKRNYIHRVFYLNDYAKEIRLNPNISDKLFDDFKKSNNELYEINKQYAKKRFILGFIRNYLCNDFLNGIAYVTYLVYRAVVVRAISYSSVVVLYNSVWTLKGGFYLLMDIFPLAIENSLYIDKINDFLAYKTKIISEKNLPVPNQPTELELKDVSFAYNQNDGNIINNLNLKIEPYKKIALVGYNGAGKTTLVKLLMRLYDPSCGAIYVNNTDIKDYNVEDYRDKIGTIFQDFKIFAATIKENVLLDQNITADNDKLLYSLNKSGFDSKLTHLKNGVDTNLTTEFEEDGINLSGGESQKLAIARAFYKNSNLIILDEPSSALDPIAEYSVNKAMLEAAKEKTVIFISHRLSTTRNADEIYMLENGRIIECGTHNELLTLNGKYAQMWEAQSRNYTC
ncbi:atp-binding cassette sub-family b [Holotrichia oblita]|nr:atp-binding cassette sub-family b [Holotrichia oblita]